MMLVGFSLVAASRNRSSRLPMMSVQPSFTRSRSRFPPESVVLKFTIRSRCQPAGWEANQAGSVGVLWRASTEEGVRWKT